MWDKAANDCAVILGCDATYLPFSLHLAWQIATRLPLRGFDILILSATPLTLPDWTLAAGIRPEVLPLSVEWAALDGGKFGPAVFLPFAAIPRLALRYRRILALDGDIWFEGGDLDRLLRLDLGPHAVAAARDVMFFYGPYNPHAREFRERGMPAHPYLNSGVILYDTAAFAAQDLERRLLDRAQAEAGKLWLADQTLLNLVLAGQFAELAPAWNWVSTSFLPLVSRRYQVRLRHFIGDAKPWRDTHRQLDAGYAAGYADFFRSFLPEAQILIDTAPGPQLDFRAIGNIVLDHLKSRAKVQSMLSRFPDEWHVVR